MQENGLFHLITIQGGGQTFSALIFWLKKRSYPWKNLKKKFQIAWKFSFFKINVPGNFCSCTPWVFPIVLGPGNLLFFLKPPGI